MSDYIKNSNKKTDFLINHKKEFLVTYAHDYFGALKKEAIIKLFDNGDWDWCIGKEKGHESGDIHDHFHVYLKYKGKNKKGIYSTNKRLWDVDLDIGEPNLLIAFSSESWPKDKDGFKITMGHPNIKFKGDKSDPNCKNTYKMLDYVTKQRKEREVQDWEIWSNFDWQELLKKLEKQKNGNIKEFQQLEWDFCIWLKDQILSRPTATKDEIRRDIMKQENFCCVYLQKHYNYNGVLDTFYKNKRTEKPTPYYGKFWIPNQLANYLDYLNDFVKRWYNGEVKRSERPKCLYLSGSGNCGKTSLLSCFGSFSYWCTCWNINNWEGEASYNFFDDYDGSEDYKGNQISSNWTLLKPWIGGQDLVTISGKFKQPTTVANNKPCIFISNKHFEDRFPDDAKEYFRDCKATIVNLGKGQCLYKTPIENGLDSRTIDGYAGWTEYDTRNTWFYLNKVAPIIENKENEPPASPANHELSDNVPILLPDLPNKVNDNAIDVELLNEVENNIGRLLSNQNIDKSRRKRKYSVTDTNKASKKTRRESI